MLIAESTLWKDENVKDCIRTGITVLKFVIWGGSRRFHAFSRRAVVSYWRKYVHEVLVNRLGGLSLPRKSVVRLTDRPDMTLDVYRGRKTTMPCLQIVSYGPLSRRRRTKFVTIKPTIYHPKIIILFHTDQESQE